MKKTTTAVLIGTTMLALAACDASEEFKESCKQAGGEVMRENEVSSILGMASVSFVAGRPAPPRPASRPGKIDKVVPAPKAPPANPNVTSVPTVNPLPQAAGKSGKKKSDNDWVCVKNGNILFEED
jgi:hypothetical protein